MLTTAEREELGRLRKEVREIRTEREILKHPAAFLREAPAVKFAWIAAEKAACRVSEVCRALGRVAEWFLRVGATAATGHAQRDQRLRVKIRASCEASKHRYGSPRIHRDLLEDDEAVSRKRVIRLMQEDDLVARRRKRFKCTTMSDHHQPVAANVLDRAFTADAPNRRGVGNTAEFVIGEITQDEEHRQGRET